MLWSVAHESQTLLLLKSAFAVQQPSEQKERRKILGQVRKRRTKAMNARGKDNKVI